MVKIKSLRYYKNGTMFVSLVVVGLALMIFIFSLPALTAIIGEAAKGQGSATSFFMHSFIFIIFIVLIAMILKIFSSGEGFFS